MKNYTITVNGTAYNVSVEEGTSAAPGSCACCSCSGTCCRSPHPQQRLLLLPLRLLPLTPQSPAL